MFPASKDPTIPHRVQGEAAAGVVMLRPATAGTGVIAGGPCVQYSSAQAFDVLSKSLTSEPDQHRSRNCCSTQELEEPPGSGSPPWPAHR